jgi:hypothetical protein
MLRLKAESFYGVTSTLQTLRARVGQLKGDEITEAADGGIVVRFERDPVAAIYLQDKATELVQNLETLGTRSALISAKKLSRAVSGPDGFLWGEVTRLCEEVHSRLVDDLTMVAVFVLEESKAALFDPAEPLFGSEVASRFATEAAFEIDEAAKCLALGRPTASVFHMMRTMEVAIRAIARCLQISDPIRPAERNWASILGKIEGGITAKWPTGASRMSGDGALFEDLRASLDRTSLVEKT